MLSALYYSKIEIRSIQILSIALNLELTSNYCSARASILLCTRSRQRLLLNPNSHFRSK